MPQALQDHSEIPGIPDARFPPDMQVAALHGQFATASQCEARPRRLNKTAEIVMVERGPYVSYANCGLPYHVGGVIEQERSLPAATERTFRGIFAIERIPRAHPVGRHAVARRI